ncbi:hypothetical protein ACVGWK_01570 [Enterobacter sichuanensis]
MTTGRAVYRPAEQIPVQGMISLKVGPVLLALSGRVSSARRREMTYQPTAVTKDLL